MDYAALGLLDGLKGEARDQRTRLLESLERDGFTAEQLAAAAREHRLALLPVDRVLGGTHTAAEIEQLTGAPAALVIRVRRVQGLPEPGPHDRVFSEADVEAARSVQQFLHVGIDEELILQISRVLGEGMARLAATITAAFAQTFLRPGDGEDEVALRFAGLAGELTPAMTPILVGGFNAHLRDSVQRGMLGREELEAGNLAQSQPLAICFADVVGFTGLGAELDVLELGLVASRLAALAVLVAQAPVRLIKTIGDAAMLISPEPAPLVEAALALVEDFELEQLPSIRAGIAFGPAHIRAGDYYGHSVNLASRVTGVARPGSVLCTREIRDGAADAFRWSAAGRHRLKGLPEPIGLHRARRDGAQAGTATGAAPP